MLKASPNRLRARHVPHVTQHARPAVVAHLGCPCTCRRCSSHLCWVCALPSGCTSCRRRPWRTCTASRAACLACALQALLQSEQLLRLEEVLQDVSRCAPLPGEPNALSLQQVRGQGEPFFTSCTCTPAIGAQHNGDHSLTSKRLSDAFAALGHRR